MKKFLLAALMCLAFVGLRAQTWDPNYIDGHLYFKFVDSYDFQIRVNEDTRIEPSEMKQYANLFAEYGVTLITRPLYAFNDPVTERIIRLEFSQYKRIDQFIAALEALPEVEYAERVPLPHLLVTYNDPYSTGSWTSAGPYQWNLTMINAQDAWAAQVASSSIKVAVVDNAVWGSHPDLQIASSNLCSYASGYASSGDANPPSSVSQNPNCQNYFYYGSGSCDAYEWSHGTHCAGMVAAKNNNGIGISSIGGGNGTSGSGLTLMGVRAANNSGYLYYTSNGVTWAANHGANVISMSFGGSSSSQSEQSSYRNLYNNGVVLVAAAGNEGDEDNYKSYPACYQGVISVASVDNSGKLSYFSQWGSGRADIAAPGGFYNAGRTNNILSTTWCTNQYNRYTLNTSALNGQYYDGMQGTSMACPTAAGLCGLMLSAYPQMTPDQVLTCLQDNEQPLATGSNQIDGHGYIDAAASVNCAKALAAVLRANPSSVVIASRGGSKTVEITAANNLSGNWTASCNNAAFTLSTTSGAGNGATTTMTISADANGTGAPITGTITITQDTGSNQQTATISVRQNDQSDFCGWLGNELFDDDSLKYNITSQYYSETYGWSLFAQRFPNNKVGTVDSITLAGYYVSASSGNLKVSIYNDNNGVPGTELASKNISMTALRTAAGSPYTGVTPNVYIGDPYSVAFDSPVDVSGTYYVVFDFSNITAVDGVYDCAVWDIMNNDATQDTLNNGLLKIGSSWYRPGDYYQGLDYYDIGVSSHFCESTAPWLTVNPTEIYVTPLMCSEEIEISANCDWTATSSCDWVSVSPSSGTDMSTAALSIAQNMGDERNCTVTFTYEGGGTVELPISQMAHQSGCNEAALFDWQHFGWRVNDAHTDYQLDQDSLYYTYAIPYDDDNTVDTGYIYGNNRYLDLTAAANMIEVYGTAMINSATFVYGTTGTGGNVTFKIWDRDKNVLASKTESMSSLSSGNIYEWDLDTPIEVNDTVYVGADFSGVTTGSFFYFYTNLWYANQSKPEALNTAWIVEEYNGNNYWIDYYGTIDAFPSICYNGGHLNIDMAIEQIDNVTDRNPITTATVNPGDSLIAVYKLMNLGEAPYVDSTKITVLIDTIELGSFAYPPMNFIAGGALTDNIGLMSWADMMSLGLRHNDVLNLCLRVSHINDTYEWVDMDLTNNQSCVAVTISCPPVINTVIETACGSYTFGSETYNETGIYSDTLTAANGCDSIVTLNLTINQPVNNSETVTECSSYVWHGTAYTQTGDYTYENTANNCTSIDTLHLTITGAPVITVSGNTTVTPGGSTTLTASGANSYVWKQNGNTVSTSNTFTTPALQNTTIYTVEGTVGDCTGETTVTITVQSAPTTYSETSATACGSFTWDLNGMTYNESGDIQYTLSGGNAQGGDSIITLHLTIYPIPQIQIEGDNIIESGESTTLTASGAVSYVWNDGTNNVSNQASYTASPTSSTTYYITGTDANTCTGSTTFTVVVNSNDTEFDTVYRSACSSYEWNGHNYTASGTYMSTEGTNVHVLVLTINQPPIITVSGNTSIYTNQNTTLTASGAQTYSWSTNGNVVSTSNPFTTPALTTTTTYTVTGTDANTCTGSTQVTVSVTSAPSTSGDTTATACDSFTWWLSGQTYTSSGNYQAITSNVNGGDSTVTLHLTINYGTNSIEEHTACDSYTWHGTTYTASNNTATYSTTGTNGCDNVITLHLTINYSTNNEITETACDSYTWALNGQQYTYSGNYSYSTTGTNGCPANTTLHLTVNQSTNDAITETACDSYTWFDQTYTASGVYTHTGENQWGCPDNSTLTLTINHSTTSDIYDSVEAGQAYNNYGFNISETEVATGTYTNTIPLSNSNGCDSIITLHLTVTGNGQPGEGIDDVDGFTMRIYPNPASSKVDIDCESISAVRVYDMAGRMLDEQTAINSNNAQVDVSRFAEGVYVFSITTQSGDVVKQKVVVKH